MTNPVDFAEVLQRAERAEAELERVKRKNSEMRSNIDALNINFDCIIYHAVENKWQGIPALAKLAKEEITKSLADNADALDYARAKGRPTNHEN